MLPPEIFEHIFSYLSTDPKSLKACTLVHRDWLHRTQHHLFDKFVMDYFDPNDREHRDILRCQRLLDLFSCSPHLADHFQYVKIELQGQFPDVLRSQVNVLHTLLPQLHRVRSLLLISNPFGIAFTDSVKPMLLAAMKQMVANPAFVSLELRNWLFSRNGADLLGLLGSCSGSLRSLSFGAVTFRFPGSEPEAARSPPLPLNLPKLEEFRVAMASGFADVQLFYMPRLRSIYWPLHRQIAADDYCPSSHVLDGIAGFPETWTFHMHTVSIEDDVARICQVFNVEKLSGLRHLGLSIDCWDTPNLTFPTLKYLQTIIPLTQVTSMTISFLIEVSAYRSAWKEADWERLASALLPLIEASSAESISCRLKVGSWEEPTPPDPNYREPTDEEEDDSEYLGDPEVLKEGDDFYKAELMIEKVKAMMEMKLVGGSKRGVSITSEYIEESIISNAW
ncbi:hypothetical protein ONZ45_g9034 [Pleurotus djamor]|nr:hypothetical protein ONZ45_g9034 [Pleurotus djamor]